MTWMISAVMFGICADRQTSLRWPDHGPFKTVRLPLVTRVPGAAPDDRANGSVASISQPTKHFFMDHIRAQISPHLWKVFMLLTRSSEATLWLPSKELRVDGYTDRSDTPPS